MRWECLGIEMLDTLRIKNQGKNWCVFEMNQGSSLPQYKVSFVTMEKLDNNHRKRL